MYMHQDNQDEIPTSIMPMTNRDFIGVLILGTLIGVAIWGVSVVLDKYLFASLVCGDYVATTCDSSVSYANSIASIAGAIAMLIGLIRLRVFRPLLVVLAAMISLWGLPQLLHETNWFVVAIACALLYGLAYGVYTWLARVRQFVLAAATIVVLVVIVRLILHS